ncbi:MAG TPA: TonB family protein [Terriglobales bacterium]|jgi:TonB family protein|nr:TonB family protein [Terriglobales bacterium]
MSPLSLLFSSNEEASRPLAQALQELEFEVEHCREIFAAVERLTSRSFEIIVADWNDGVEASFLLKTSRELKSNSAAFTVAVVNHEEAASAARLIGADLAILRPISPEKVKYALLNCDEFLRCLRTWLPKFNNTSQSKALPARIESHPAWMYDQDSAASPNEPVSLAESLGPSPVRSRRRSGWGIAMWPHRSRSAKAQPKPQPKAHSGRRASLLAIACGVAAFSVGYAVSDGQRIEAGSVTKFYQQALEKTHDWLRPSNNREPAADEEIAQDMGPAPPGARTGPHPRIRVTPVAAHPSTAATKPPSQEPLQVKPEGVSGLSQPSANSTDIPDSLRTPVQIASVRAVNAAFGPSLLSTLEPVSLPEDVSQKLLVQKVQPIYPEQALRSGLHGPVVLEAWIAKDGTVRDLKLVRGYFVLGQAAYQAVKQWRYKPYLLNGRAVEAQTYITVDFKLP